MNLKRIYELKNKFEIQTLEFLTSKKGVLLCGVGMLMFGLENLALAQQNYNGNGGYDQGSYFACGVLLNYVETGFGALLATAAGIGGIIASALGGFKAAWSLLVVSVGSFILRAYLSLFNNGCQA